MPIKSHDDLLKDIGLRIPDFGGMYLSKDNSILNVYVLSGKEDALDTEEVKRAIEAVLKADATSRRELRLIPAQYSMAQLYGWYQLAQTVVWNFPSVTMTDLDEGENRIEVGVENFAEVEQLRESLIRLGIPRKAVIVREREGERLETHRLTDRIPGDVLEGGYQISRPAASPPGAIYACTLGYPVERTSLDGSVQAGFITAGHCTENLGTVDGTQFYQSSQSTNPSAIGTETIDPAFSTIPINCPTGNLCRHSDSAFIELKSGVSYNLGVIAKPTNQGVTTVNHMAEFRIVSDIAVPKVGQTINKVGRSTGWTSGQVQDTCAQGGSSTNRIVCLHTASYSSSGADSGAPVFKITNSPNIDDVVLVGIHRGRLGGYASYSRINGIYGDLGSEYIWNACDPALNC